MPNRIEKPQKTLEEWKGEGKLIKRVESALGNERKELEVGTKACKVWQYVCLSVCACVGCVVYMCKVKNYTAQRCHSKLQLQLICRVAKKNEWVSI